MDADFSHSTIFLGDRADESVDAVTPREGHGSELSRRVSRSLLLPQGRPSVWLLVLGAFCAYVLVETLRVYFA